MILTGFLSCFFRFCVVGLTFAERGGGCGGGDGDEDSGGGEGEDRVEGGGERDEESEEAAGEDMLADGLGWEESAFGIVCLVGPKSDAAFSWCVRSGK